MCESIRKFDVIGYTAGRKTLKATDDFLIRAWDIFAKRDHGGSNAETIRAFLKVEHKTMLTGISANAAFALEWDVCPPSDGAALYPDQYQPWEREGKQLCVRGDDLSFSLTGYGATIKDRVMDEVHKHYKTELLSINSNKYIHGMEL